MLSDKTLVPGYGALFQSTRVVGPTFFLQRDHLKKIKRDVIDLCVKQQTKNTVLTGGERFF